MVLIGLKQKILRDVHRILADNRMISSTGLKEFSELSRMGPLGGNLMKVKAWNNGNHRTDGNGYGVKIEARDRDAILHREWKVILLELEGESASVEINIDKDSFWNSGCRELISVGIGRWLIHNQLAPWVKGHPPVLTLEPITLNRFRLFLQG
jgi:hypothetical protein